MNILGRVLEPYILPSSNMNEKQQTFKDYYSSDQYTIQRHQYPTNAIIQSNDEASHVYQLPPGRGSKMARYTAALTVPFIILMIIVSLNYGTLTKFTISSLVLFHVFLVTNDSRNDNSKQ